MSTDSATSIRAFLAASRQQQTNFLAELVRVPSDNPPGDCAPHAARTAALLEALGLAVERHPEFGVERLDLLSRGKRLEIGVFLGRGEKTRLATDLSAALARARQGPRF